MNAIRERLSWEHIALAAIMLVAVALRLWNVGYAPGQGALNGDEALSAYESWSLMNYGIDSNGYHFPTYLVGCGSGMNALQTYVLMPFIALFGTTPLGVRLAPALFGILTVWVFYQLAKRCRGQHFALVATALFVAMPWHTVMSRWSLEANWLPGMLLIAFYLLAKSSGNSKWLPLCVTCFGLCFYCYATAWIVMPIVMAAATFYWVKSCKDKRIGVTLVSIAIYLMLAAPAVLFVLINKDVLPEIRTEWLSIPKLTVFRSGEVSLASIPSNLLRMVKLLVFQKDGLPWSAVDGFGFYYYMSLPFAVGGAVVTTIRIYRNRKKSLSPELLLIIQLTCALILGSLIATNCNKLNIIHIPLEYCACVGIWELIALMKRKSDKLWKAAAAIVALAYAACTILFVATYFTTYDVYMYKFLHGGLREALEAAPSEGTIHIAEDVAGPYYNHVLLYARLSPEDFSKSVVWKDPKATYREPLTFCNYDFRDFTQDVAVAGDTYIARKGSAKADSWMHSHLSSVQEFGTYYLGRA